MGKSGRIFGGRLWLKKGCFAAAAAAADDGNLAAQPLVQSRVISF
jgi:hypothetical protein